jgi:hypothetical protein
LLREPCPESLAVEREAVTLPRRESPPQPEALPQRTAAAPMLKAVRSQPQEALAQAASAGTEEEVVVVVTPQLQAQGAVASRPQKAVTQAAEEAGTPQPQAQASVIAVPRPQEALARAVAPGLALAAVPQLRQAPPVCGLPAAP